jgi:UDP-N-acetylmuramate: L-alanyl-gamma-D-glutamyl-meso-diaminopimelate ligase
MWIHFIGIGGISMGQIAMALAENGHQISGSDEAVYEPMKSLLANAKNINFKEGYSYENLLAETYRFSSEKKFPDLVVAQSGLNLKNKELLFAQKQGIEVVNYPQLLAKFLIRPESIVVAGSYGKTTTTTLLVKIFNDQQVPINYMFGGVAVDGTKAVNLTDEAKYSIIEGDEYISARWDMKSKFFYYSPKYLVLTGYAYDHTDVFLTPEDYRQNFQKFIEMVPADGLIIYNADANGLKELVVSAKARVIEYSEAELAEIKTLNVKVLGDYNLLNMLAAKKLAVELKLNEEKINGSLADFQGLKRRLEIVHTGTNLMVIDDFGATPAKAKAAISAIKAKYPEAKLTVVFEPNIGSRTEAALPEFAEVFQAADQLVLPEFSEIRQSGIVSEIDFLNYLQGKVNVKAASTDSAFDLVKQGLVADQQNIVLLLSSHSVDLLVNDLKKL